MKLPKILSDTLDQLPSYSGIYDEDKLIAKTLVVDQVSGWEFYLCEYDSESQHAYGLVNGFALEYGPIPFNSESNIEQAAPTVIVDFVPTSVSNIRKRLMNPNERSLPIENTHEHDVFISYATEDEQLASRIAGALEFYGFKVWFAPRQLVVGDRLRISLEEAMKRSYAGILLLSEKYIEKPWTNFEHDNLMLQFIKKGKKLLPIWHGVSEDDIEDFSSTLTDIIGLKTQDGFEHITNNLILSLAQKAPTAAAIPDWEDPVYRFMQGKAELRIYRQQGNVSAGLVFNLWNAIESFDASRYPIFVQGRFLQKDDLLSKAAEIITEQSERVISMIGKDRMQKIREICREHGFNVE